MHDAHVISGMLSLRVPVLFLFFKLKPLGTPWGPNPKTKTEPPMSWWFNGAGHRATKLHTTHVLNGLAKKEIALTRRAFPKVLWPTLGNSIHENRGFFLFVWWV